ncbi:PA domain-containing protein [Kordiimonas aestuarii]|uniref:PA domain-containing protein n=1 Tax=Kordiimonas aestuarii TaxID=1005925 RepID=UPI0021D13772|nr:PA domain-containing protein [Kordiimonas aestuarii]
MPNTTRRHFIAGATLLPLATGATSAALQATPQPVKATSDHTQIQADLARYIGFGMKQAGGTGDNACGDWMASELEKLGFTTEKQTMSAPYFTPDRCELVCGALQADVWPQPIVMATEASGITGPLVRVNAQGLADKALSGAIALVDLPFARWSSVFWKGVKTPVEAAFAQGAMAAIIVTNGPTGKVIALNTDGRKPVFAGPVALMAPNDAQPYFAAATQNHEATLFMTGDSGHRPAFNFISRIDNDQDRWLVVSTPRSGWFGCAGERGPGIAAWLHLARWASRTVRDYNLAFICNSGHEYQYLGAEEALHAIAPKPQKTAFWLHLGANIAARDWHEITGNPAPLPSADPQRYLVTSPALLPVARELFKGQVGLEAPYSSEVLSAGELTNVIKTGYPSVAGVFGLHRYHHVIDDDERCVPTDKIAEAANGFRRLLEHVLKLA